MKNFKKLLIITLLTINLTACASNTINSNKTESDNKNNIKLESIDDLEKEIEQLEKEVELLENTFNE